MLLKTEAQKGVLKLDRSRQGISVTKGENGKDERGQGSSRFFDGLGSSFANQSTQKLKKKNNNLEQYSNSNVEELDYASSELVLVKGGISIAIGGSSDWDTRCIEGLSASCVLDSDEGVAEELSELTTNIVRR
jgi:hypothetical protein